MKKKLILILAVLMILVFILGVFSPINARLPLYLLIFSLIYCFFTVLISVVIDVAYGKMDLQKRRFAAIILGFSPTLILALASLSSITFIDFVLATGIPFVIVWYGVRRGVIK